MGKKWFKVRKLDEEDVLFIKAHDFTLQKKDDSFWFYNKSGEPVAMVPDSYIVELDS